MSTVKSWRPTESLYDEYIKRLDTTSATLSERVQDDLLSTTPSRPSSSIAFFPSSEKSVYNAGNNSSPFFSYPSPSNVQYPIYSSLSQRPSYSSQNSINSSLVSGITNSSTPEPSSIVLKGTINAESKYTDIIELARENTRRFLKQFPEISSPSRASAIDVTPPGSSKLQPAISPGAVAATGELRSILGDFGDLVSEKHHLEKLLMERNEVLVKTREEAEKFIETLWEWFNRALKEHDLEREATAQMFTEQLEKYKVILLETKKKSFQHIAEAIGQKSSKSQLLFGFSAWRDYNTLSLKEKMADKEKLHHSQMMQLLREKGESFFFMNEKAAGAMLEKKQLRMKMYAFGIWKSMIGEEAVKIRKMNKAVKFWSLGRISPAWNSWKDLVQGRAKRRIKLRKAMSFWTRRTLRGMFDGWHCVVSRRKFAQQKVAFALCKIGRGLVASVFSAWYDHSRKMKRQMRTVLLHLRRGEHRNRHLCFLRWKHQVRMLVIERHKLDAASKIIRLEKQLRMQEELTALAESRSQNAADELSSMDSKMAELERWVNLLQARLRDEEEKVLVANRSMQDLIASAQETEERAEVTINALAAAKNRAEEELSALLREIRMIKSTTHSYVHSSP